VPGNNDSAGKRLSGKTRTRPARGASVRQGSQWLRAGLTQAAHAAAHQKNNYLAVHYYRLAGRRGKKRAKLAVAHSILVIAYHIIQRREPYQDLGSNYYDGRQKVSTANRLTRRLEKLGYLHLAVLASAGSSLRRPRHASPCSTTGDRQVYFYSAPKAGASPPLR
jgi:transposase